jgi:two-component system chemotaxis response regulator CheY
MRVAPGVSVRVTHRPAVVDAPALLPGAALAIGVVMFKPILIVDDSPAIRSQVSQVLTQAGYAVIEACNGQEGLRQAWRASMAFCDVNVPGVDGVRFVERLRPLFVPVVMLTAQSRPELVARARTAGARGWMLKPFKPSHLLVLVRKLVGGRLEAAASPGGP